MAGHSTDGVDERWILTLMSNWSTNSTPGPSNAIPESFLGTIFIGIYRQRLKNIQILTFDEVRRALRADIKLVKPVPFSLIENGRRWS
jgi:hypothetical protein